MRLILTAGCRYDRAAQPVGRAVVGRSVPMADVWGNSTAKHLGAEQPEVTLTS
jgi:hypothetical protein